MDITEPLDLLDSDSFSCILDKGTLDSVACSDLYSKKAKQMIDNIHRILAPGGFYFCVSYARPDIRLNYLKDSAYRWQTEILKIQKK